VRTSHPGRSQLRTQAPRMPPTSSFRARVRAARRRWSRLGAPAAGADPRPWWT